jgi:hypothetical protein
MLLSAMALLAFPAFAGGGTSAGLVTAPLVNDSGIFMFGAGVHNNKPACSTIGDSQAWAFDAKTPAGKAMQALMMLAYAQGKTVAVNGSGVCDAWGDRERPSNVYISN